MKFINDANEKYVTKQEFCEICGISLSTAYKLIKSEKIHFEKKCDGLLHYYSIPITDAEKYISDRNKRNILSKGQLSKLYKFYREKLKCYPDIINTRDICVITGYGKETVRIWIQKGRIPGIIVRKRFIITKDDLLAFLTSPYYANIMRKSQKHIEDLKSIGIT